LLETYFTTLPDSVVNEELAPSRTPIALVVVSGDEVSANIVARPVARCCSESPNWKWEALPPMLLFPLCLAVDYGSA
jgi:hypothetical protein